MLEHFSHTVRQYVPDTVSESQVLALAAIARV